MPRRPLALIAFCLLAFLVSNLDAARPQLFIDGDNRTAYDASRGKVGRAEWTAVVKARKGTILRNDFQGVNIDAPADNETSVGHFTVFFSRRPARTTKRFKVSSCGSKRLAR